MTAYDLLMALQNEGSIHCTLEEMLILTCKFIDKAVLDPGLFEEFLIYELPIEFKDEDDEDDVELGT